MAVCFYAIVVSVDGLGVLVRGVICVDAGVFPCAALLGFDAVAIAGIGDDATSTITAATSIVKMFVSFYCDLSYAEGQGYGSARADVFWECKGLPVAYGGRGGRVEETVATMSQADE